jgi:ribosomal protein L37AE/L43A
MMTTKSIYKCPVCGDEVKVSAREPIPKCQKCYVEMKLVKGGLMTK